MTFLPVTNALEKAFLDLHNAVKSKVKLYINNQWIEVPEAYVEKITFNDDLEEEGHAKANTFTIEFNNRLHWFSDSRYGAFNADFTNPSAVYLNGVQQSDGWGFLRPNVRVRIYYTSGVRNEWIARHAGYVDENGFTEIVGGGRENIVTVKCVDYTKIMIDEPSEDEEGRFTVYIDKSVCNPADTANSLVHLIGAEMNLHHWLPGAVIEASSVVYDAVDLESGDLTGFDAVAGPTRLTVQTGEVAHGTYSGKVTLPSGSAYSSSYGSMNISGGGRLNARAYVFFPTGAYPGVHSATNRYFAPIGIYGPAGELLCEAYFVGNSTQLQLYRIRSNDDIAGQVYATPVLSVSTGVWHSIECEIIKGAGTGSARVYIDGVQAGEVTGIDNDGQTIDEVRVGHRVITTGTPTVEESVYFDDLLVKTTGMCGPYDPDEGTPADNPVVVTVASTAGLQAGMLLHGSYIEGLRIESITDGTHFTTANATGSGTADIEATRILCDAVPIIIPYAPITESPMTEISLLAEASLSVATFNEEDFLCFKDSRYTPGWTDPSVSGVMDNSLFSGIEKNPIFSDRKNIVKVKFDKYQFLSTQSIWRLAEDLDEQTGKNAYVIPGVLSGAAQAGSTLTAILLSASHVQADDYYVGWELEIDNEVREVIAYSNATNQATVKRGYSTEPDTKAYTLVSSLPITSRINEYMALYNVTTLNAGTKEAGHEVVYAENIDITPAVEYVLSGVTYTAFHPSRLSVGEYDTATYANRAVVRLVNNTADPITVTRLVINGRPLVKFENHTYGERDSATSDRTSAGYIGKREVTYENKYFTDHRLPSGELHYEDWTKYKLDFQKNPMRELSLDTVRPLLWWMTGALVTVKEERQGTDIEYTARIEGISGTVRKGRASLSFTLKQWMVGWTGVPAGGSVVEAITGSGTYGVTSEMRQLLVDLGNDNKLTPLEKKQVAREWDIIVARHAQVGARATGVGLDTELVRTNYDDAYDALDGYLNPALLGDMTIVSDINGVDFRNFFTGYYNKEELLVNAISDLMTTHEEYIDGFEGDGGTKLPTAPTLYGYGGTRSAFLWWTRQMNLTGAKVRYELQVSLDTVHWFALGGGGEDPALSWKGDADPAVTTLFDTSLEHKNLPLNPGTPTFTSRTYYYRVRQRKSDGTEAGVDFSSWSGTVGVTVETVKAHELPAGVVDTINMARGAFSRRRTGLLQYFSWNHQDCTDASGNGNDGVLKEE